MCGRCGDLWLVVLGQREQPLRPDLTVVWNCRISTPPVPSVLTPVSNYFIPTHLIVVSAVIVRRNTGATEFCEATYANVRAVPKAKSLPAGETAKTSHHSGKYRKSKQWSRRHGWYRKPT